MKLSFILSIGMLMLYMMGFLLYVTSDLFNKPFIATYDSPSYYTAILLVILFTPIPSAGIMFTALIVIVLHEAKEDIDEEVRKNVLDGKI